MDEKVENFLKLGASFFTGSALDIISDPYIRGAQTLNWIPSIMRNTTHDAFLGFTLACTTALGYVSAQILLGHAEEKKKLTWNQILIMSVAMSVLFLSIAETSQGVLQLFHFADKGFAWIDFLAYPIGALGLPLLDFSARKLSRVITKARK